MVNKDDIIIEKYKQIKVSAALKYIRKYFDFKKSSNEANNKESDTVTSSSFSIVFYSFLENLGFRAIHVNDVNNFLKANTLFRSLREVIVKAKQSTSTQFEGELDKRLESVHSRIMSWLEENADEAELAYIKLSSKSQSDYSYSERRLNEDLTLAIALKDFEAASLFAEMINESQVPALEWNSSDDGSIQELYVHDAMYHMPSRIHSIIFNEAKMFESHISDTEKEECLDATYSTFADYDDVFSKSDSIIAAEVEGLLSDYVKQKEEENPNDEQKS